MSSNPFDKPSEKIRFRWSSEVILLTVLGGLILAIVGVISFPDLILHPGAVWKLIFGIVFYAVVLAGIGWAIVMIPLYITMDGSAIRIHRAFKTVIIPITEIIEIRILRKPEAAHGIRRWGSGGFLGFLGRFRSPGGRHFTMYATEMENLLLIGTSSKQYVVSCTEAKRIVAAVYWLVERKAGMDGETGSTTEC